MPFCSPARRYEFNRSPSDNCRGVPTGANLERPNNRKMSMLMLQMDTVFGTIKPKAPQLRPKGRLHSHSQLHPEAMLPPGLRLLLSIALAAGRSAEQNRTASFSCSRPGVHAVASVPMMIHKGNMTKATAMQNIGVGLHSASSQSGAET